MARLPITIVLTFAFVYLAGCEQKKAPAPDQNVPAPAPTAGERTAAPAFAIPEVDVSGLPMKLQMKMGAARQAARSDPNDARRVSELGALYYVHGFPQAAVACFEHTARLEPNDFGAWYLLARAYEKAGDSAQAVTCYEKALAAQAEYQRQHPEQSQVPYHPAHIRIGALLLESNPPRAAEHFRMALDALPNNPPALVGLGRIALADKRPDEAAQYFRRTLAIVPRYGPAHAGLAAALRAQGRTDEAARHEQEAAGNATLEPMDDPLETNLLRRGLRLETLLADANQFAQQGALDQADRILQLARDVDPDGKLTRNAAAIVLLGRNKPTDAVREFRSLVEQFPDFDGARTNLALALAMSEQGDEAKQILGELLDRNPADTGLLETYCRIMTRLGQPAEAIDRLNRSLSAASDPITKLEIAELLFRMSRPQEAVAAARQVVETEPGSAAAHYRFGVLLQAAEDKDAAAREWREALRLVPEHLPSRLALVSVLLTQKDYAAVEQTLREGLEYTPSATDLLNGLAWLRATCPDAARRNGEEAVRLAEQVVRLSGGQNPAHLDTLAAAYAEAGRFDDARRTIQRALEIAQNSRRADVAKECEQRKALYEQNQPYREAP